jgi:hypothetical protein
MMVQLDIATAVIERLVALHGWYPDRIRTNWAGKEYDSAVGPKRAQLWMSFDAENNQFFLKGEFTSAGEDVLANCMTVIRGTATVDEVEAAVDAHLVRAEKAITSSYAVRLLPWRAPSTVPFAFS